MSIPHPQNMVETLVESRLDELLRTSSVCRCARCRADMLALALNQLPPKYIVSTQGEAFARLSTLKGQFQADITCAVQRAIDAVQAHPRHDQ